MKTSDVLRYYKTQSDAARAIGVQRAAVSKWVKSGIVPELTAYKIQVLTGGRLKVDPDLYRESAA